MLIKGTAACKRVTCGGTCRQVMPSSKVLEAREAARAAARLGDDDGDDDDDDDEDAEEEAESMLARVLRAKEAAGDASAAVGSRSFYGTHAPLVLSWLGMRGS